MNELVYYDFRLRKMAVIYELIMIYLTFLHHAPCRIQISNEEEERKKDILGLKIQDLRQTIYKLVQNLTRTCLNLYLYHHFKFNFKLKYIILGFR